MCQFCHQHGEGKKWYLQAKNYSEDLLSDISRIKFIQQFVSDPAHLAEQVEGMAKLDKLPSLVRGMVQRMITRKMKKVHFGQVVPIEEIEQIFGFVNSIVRVACICRHATLGAEKRYCYGISLSPRGGQFARIMAGAEGSFYRDPNYSGVEKLTRDEAMQAFRNHEKEGLCHTVWTFHTPFIGGICNCDRADCLAMRSTVGHACPVMFRAEWVGRVDPDACIGCRSCMRLCQFGAIGYSAANKKATIDPRRCFGCGTCRAGCSKDAIKLDERTKVPVAANLW
jgi:Pyruvate/2-oxoacid:ferredoxin oxidoreductase delta subunit